MTRFSYYAPEGLNARRLQTLTRRQFAELAPSEQPALLDQVASLPRHIHTLAQLGLIAGPLPDLPRTALAAAGQSKLRSSERSIWIDRRQTASDSRMTSTIQ